MFHHIRAKNISLERNRQTASWNPTQTGGCAFTVRPLCPGEPVTLTLDGTGGVEVGIVNTDPVTWTNRVPVSMTGVTGYQFLNDVKIHRRKCTISIAIDTNTREVTSTYGGGHYIQKIETDRQYWLVVDVKYGLIECKLDNQDNDNCRQQFSKVLGHNMQLFNDPTVARTLTRSPAAVCFYNEPVRTGQKLLIQCSPKAHQGTTPGRYYISLRYTKMSPEELKQSYPYTFDVSKESGREPEWTEIEKFEKEECTGRPIILEFTGQTLKYTSASGKQNQQMCNTTDSTSNIWLVMELYGVNVKLETCNITAGVTAETMENMDVEDILALDCSRTTNRRRGMSSASSFEDTEGRRQDDTWFRSQARRLSGEGDDANTLEHVSNSIPRDIDDAVLISKHIQRNWTKLLDSFVVSEFVDLMFEKEMITMHQLGDINTKLKDSNKTAAREVLRMLSTRLISKKFMELSLAKTAQQHLMDLFFPDTTEKE